MAIDARKELTLTNFFRTLRYRGMLPFVCGLRGANSLDEHYCPNCHRLLPKNSQYCIDCGDVFAAADANTQKMRTEQGISPSSGGKKLTRPLEQDIRAEQGVSTPSGGRKKTRPLLIEQDVQRHAQFGRMNSSLLDKDYEDDENNDALDFNIEEEIASVAEPRHETWQKVVEAPDRPPIVHPPRPSFPPQPRSILRHTPYRRSQISPALLFWCSVIVIFFFVGGGVFGIVGTLGRGRVASAAGATLQITPDYVAVGATMNVRGSGFSPRTQVGFTRDAAIPVVDTNGATIIATDGDGNFTDTVIVGPDWVNGAHTISAEDAVTHKLISSPIQVTGMGDLLRPAHLGLSTTALDLGTGDPATNNIQKVVLTNLGGGQISWEAAATQSWLTISPKRGTFSSGMEAEVVIAVNRSNLPPGTFEDQVLFSSSAGDTVLPVKMSVTALQPQGEAVLQITPSTLFFTGNDGGSAPADQAVTISNPGQLSLNWTVATNAPWLTVSSQTGTVFAASSGSAVVHVDTRNLLPGTYSGTVTFNGDTTTAGSPQSIVVSVTIMPGCALAVAPNMLTFTASYLQSAPDPKVLDLNSTHCSSSIAWSASSNASWLTVGQTSGSTPASPSIRVNPAGLKPGTYTGSVTFSSDSGQQQVPVKFIMSQPAATVLSVGSTDGLNFSGVAGQNSTTTKHITLANTGDGTLSWSAKATTGNGGDWLAVNPSSGEISAHQSISLHVRAQTLASMAPDTYSGTINITGTDQQGHVVAGSPQSISVSEVVSSNCILTASPSVLAFTGVADQSAPANQSVALAIGNGCSNTLNWTTVATSDNGGKWLTISSSAGSVSANNPGTVEAGVSLAGLTTGNYSGTITITAVDSVTHASVGNSQIISVNLNVQSATPVLTVTPTALTFNITSGKASQPITISNSGGSTIDWQASLQSGAPSFISLSKGSGANLAGGNSATIDVNIDTNNVYSGKSYTTSIIVTSANNGNRTGSKSVTIPVTIHITSPTATPTPIVKPSPTTTPSPTAKPSPTVTPSPTATAAPTATATPNATESPPTPVPTVIGVPPPLQTVIPSPKPQPTATPPFTKPTQKNVVEAPKPTADIRSVPPPTLPPTVVPTQKPVVQATSDPIPSPTPTVKVKPASTPIIKGKPTLTSSPHHKSEATPS